MDERDAAATRRSDDRDREFVAFYAAHHDAAARYAVTVLGATRALDAADVMQDAWGRAWRSWTTADDERREAWFFRIVRNAALDRHRARPGVGPVPLDHVAETLPVTVDFDAALERDEALRLLAALPDHLRETLWLRAVRDLGYQEIADVLGVPVGTVMSRLSVARRKLAKRTGRRS